MTRRILIGSPVDIEVTIEPDPAAAQSTARVGGGPGSAAAHPASIAQRTTVIWTSRRVEAPASTSP